MALVMVVEQDVLDVAGHEPLPLGLRERVLGPLDQPWAVHDAQSRARSTGRVPSPPGLSHSPHGPRISADENAELAIRPCPS